MATPHHTYRNRPVKFCPICKTKKLYKEFPSQHFSYGMVVGDVCRNCLKKKDYTAASKAKQPKSGWVYFVQSDYRGLIKIGHTYHNPRTRLSSLRGSSAARLVLLFVIPGTLEKEAELHQDFAHLNVHHEWFYPASELMAYINKLKKRK